MAEPGRVGFISELANAPDQLKEWAAGRVKFHSVLIQPLGHKDPLPEALPLAVLFLGLGVTSNVVYEGATSWAKVAPEPFLLVAPDIPAESWWFIDSADWEWGLFRRGRVPARPRRGLQRMDFVAEHLPLCGKRPHWILRLFSWRLRLRRDPGAVRCAL